MLTLTVAPAAVGAVSDTETPFAETTLLAKVDFAVIDSAVAADAGIAAAAEIEAAAKATAIARTDRRKRTPP